MTWYSEHISELIEKEFMKRFDKTVDIEDLDFGKTYYYVDTFNNINSFVLESKLIHKSGVEYYIKGFVPPMVGNSFKQSDEGRIKEGQVEIDIDKIKKEYDNLYSKRNNHPNTLEGLISDSIRIAVQWQKVLENKTEADIMVEKIKEKYGE